MAGAGALGAAALVGCGDNGTPAVTPPSPVVIGDVDILNFALNLEYLEAEFYLRAATGTGLSSADSGGTGTVTGGTQVDFSGAAPAYQQYAIEIAQNELNHVRFLRSAIIAAGATPVTRPDIDFTGGFNGAAAAAKIGATFNPFQDVPSFLVGAFVFEDVGVTAYTGAAPLLSSKTYLSAAAGIQAVEAYHAAEIRTLIAGGAAQTGIQTYLTYANQISALRAALGGGNETTLSISSIVAADSTNAIAFSRTTDQVLHIVYAAGAGVQTKGGFFPSGLNGTITQTFS